MMYLINLTKGVLTMKKEKITNQQVSELEFFDSLDEFENPDLRVENFIPEMYGPATSSAIEALYPSTYLYQ